MKGLQLTDKERQLIVEALLFLGNIDVCAEHNEKQLVDILALAETLNDTNIKLNNIYFWPSEVFVEGSSKNLLERFPNLPKGEVFSD